MPISTHVRAACKMARLAAKTLRPKKTSVLSDDDPVAWGGPGGSWWGRMLREMQKEQEAKDKAKGSP